MTPAYHQRGLYTDASYGSLVTRQDTCKGYEVGEGSRRLAEGSNIETEVRGKYLVRGYQPRTEVMQAGKAKEPCCVGGQDSLRSRRNPILSFGKCSQVRRSLHTMSLQTPRDPRVKHDTHRATLFRILGPLGTQSIWRRIEPLWITASSVALSEHICVNSTL